MKLIIQRVVNASCIIDSEEHAKIAQGLVVFVGFGEEDEKLDWPHIVKKLANLRCFEDEHGKLNYSLKDLDYEILLISQFTLYGDCRKGNRPSFTKALAPVLAKSMYLELIEEFQNQNVKIKNGVFAADMQIDLINDGPVTLMLNF